MRYSIFIIALVLVACVPAFTQRTINTQKIDDYLQSEYDLNNIPGFVVTIVKNDDILFSKGYGKTSTGTVVAGDTRFAIASLSKAFTATAIMQLVESGKINLDSTVGYYLPSFPLKADRITVRHLINQTSGLGDKAFQEMGFSNQPDNLEHSLARFKGVKLLSKPGEKFHYHNPNFQIAASIVEKVTGEDFSEYLKKNIFIPLKMNGTANFANTSEFFSKGKLANGHVSVFGYPKSKREIDWFVQGAAGVITTSNDLAHWLTMNINNGAYGIDTILSAHSIKEICTPPAGTTSQYGMGWFVYDNNKIGHGGTFWTYQAEETILKKDSIGILILYNGGINIFTDPGSLRRGVESIISGDEPESISPPAIVYELIVSFLTLLAIALFVRRIKRMNKWQEKFNRKSRLAKGLIFMVPLIPIIILVFIPSIITVISGRVLNWERTFWMMPSIVISLAIASILNMVIVVMRVRELRR